ncbi:hypothetical protein MASR1M50_02510 [Burkholderiales bacterium]
MDAHRPRIRLARRDQAQAAPLVGSGNRLLLVARANAGALGQQPDLQEVRDLVGRVVELAVLHASAGTHALHVARRDALHVAHAVAVRQLALQHVADDLHVAVPMGAEAGAGRDAVLVDDAQVAPAHVGRVVIVGKREAVPAVQPAVVGVAALVGVTDLEHEKSPFNACDS